MKIISGGQTGIDRMALEVAKSLGIQTGGWAPRGWKTEIGPDPSLKEFGLRESSSPDYAVRTELNVTESDGTILFGNMDSIGSQKTIWLLKQHGKDYLVNPTADQIAEFINDKQIINVAGNRESRLPKEKLETYRQTLTKGLTILS